MGKFVTDETAIEYVFKETNMFDTFFQRDIEPGITLFLAKQRSQSDEALITQAIRFSKTMFDETNAFNWIDSNKKLYSQASVRKYAEDKELKSTVRKQFEIEGVEVFAAGTWNGDTYTIDDLDQMKLAFDENKETMKPFLKLGHDSDQKLLQTDGLPAAGWVKSLERIEDKLVACFTNVPEKIMELIKRGAYKKVSSEIYWDIAVNGKSYKHFLSAVALLGADMPAVQNLSDILQIYKNCADNNKDAIVKHYLFPSKEKFKMDDKDKEIADLKAKIEELMEKLAAKENAEEEGAAIDGEKEKELLSLKAEVKKFSQELEKETAKREDIELEKHVDSIDEITPSMKPYVLELLGKEKKSYSINDKELDKRDLLNEILKLHSASDVNLEESSTEGEKQADLTEKKIEKYMTDNKVSYRQAYTQIMKG